MASGKIISLKAAILATLAGAAASGLLVADAAAKVAAPDVGEESAPPLLLAPPQVDESVLLAHRSHSSHRSHRSHRSHSSGGRASHYSSPSYSSPSYSGSSASGKTSSGKTSSGKASSGKTSLGSSMSGKAYADTSSGPASKPAKRVPPKPAKVSLVALPGGSIFVDGKLVGRDETPTLTLEPGKHSIRIENRFLGTHEYVISINEGQSGKVKIEW